ncbi:MAG: hypothetical protein ACXVIM_12135 [Acidimicrobiia bacterium]
MVLFGGVGAIAFVMRAIYAFKAPPSMFFGSDNTWYSTVARSFAEGDWGRIPGALEPTVWSLRFPPGYPVVLAVGQRLLFWVAPIDAHRWTSVALGAAAAVVVTWFAWRLCDHASPRLQIVASSVAGLLFAINPIVVGASAALMSESLALLVVALTLVQVDRLLMRDGGPSTSDIAVLGLLLALGALTRVEGILYLAAPVVAALFLTRSRRATARPWLGALAIGVLAVLAWSAFGSVVAGEPVGLSTNGTPLNGANCRSTQYGDGAGFWSAECASVPAEKLSARARRTTGVAPRDPFTLKPADGPDVEAEVSAAQLRQGLGRIRDDPVGFLRAEPFRVARALGVYWTRTQLRADTFEGRDASWERVGRWFHLLLVLPLAVVGIAAALLRRSKLGRRLGQLTEVNRLVPAFSLLPIWLAVSLLTYGSARLRAPVEPVLAVFAGLAVATLLTHHPAPTPAD